MIYLFSDGSIVYDESILTNEQKATGWAVNSLPEPEERDGFYSILKFDVDKKEIWYEYEPIPPTPEEQIKQLKDDLDNAILELTTTITTLGGSQ